MTRTVTQLRAQLSRREAELEFRGREIIETGELRRVREALGWSRDHMAERLDVNSLSLRRWELPSQLYRRGDQPVLMLPRRTTLIRIAEIIDELKHVLDERNHVGA